MASTLSDRLSRVVKTMRGEARITESNVQDMLREVRMALLEADVALAVVKDFVAHVRERALGQDVVGSLTPGQAVVGVVFDQLTALMGQANAPLDLATVPPAVILMAGLQGSGKTTSTGKLARMLRERHKKNVLVASCDIYRPAAIEQLKTLATDRVAALSTEQFTALSSLQISARFSAGSRTCLMLSESARTRQSARSSLNKQNPGV